MRKHINGLLFGCAMGALMLWSSVAQARLTPSIHRKLRRPSSELKALARSQGSKINGTGKIANIVFSSNPLPKGVVAERKYKLKTAFRKGDIINYRAYRPANILAMMKKVARNSVSRGAYINLLVFAPDGTKITKRSGFHDHFIYPMGRGLRWDMTRGAIAKAGGSGDFLYSRKSRTSFHVYMSRQKPAKYRCVVTVWEKIARSQFEYYRKFHQGRWRRFKRKKTSVYYLSAAGTFHYVVQ